MQSSSRWAEKYDKAAQDFLGDEPVLAAVQVARTGGWTALGLSAVSGLGFLAAMMHGKKKAGGLPQMFMLAVTDERIYALGFRAVGNGINPKPVRELGRWDRDRVRVSSEPVLMGTKIVIEPLAEGDRIECQGPEGELTERLVRAAAAMAVAA